MYSGYKNARHRYKKKTKLKLELWHNTRKEAARTIQHVKKDCWKNYCSGITRQTKSKDVWNFINRLKGCTPKNSSPFISENNQIITNPIQKADALVKQYASTSNDEGFSQNLPHLPLM